MQNSKNKKARTSIVVVGTGHHFQRNLTPAISKLSKTGDVELLTTIDILNRGEAGILSKTKHMKRDNGPIHKQLTEFKDKDPFVILGHTNSFHSKDAYDLLSNGFRVAVEKPYALNSKELQKYLKIGKDRVALLEYYLTMKSIPLFWGYGLVDTNSFYSKEWLIKSFPALGDYAHSIGEFNGKLPEIIGKINRVEIEVLEGKGETGTLEGRGIDTIDIKQGGGMIQDMAVHAIAPLVALETTVGSIPDYKKISVRKAFCREYMNMAKRRFALPTQRIGETYVEIAFKTIKKIDVNIRVGKYVFGDRNRRGILISGEKGEAYLDMNDCTLYINGKQVLSMDKSYYPVIRASIAEIAGEPLFSFNASRVAANAQEAIFVIQRLANKNRAKTYYKTGEKPEWIFGKANRKLSEDDIRPEDSYNRWLQLLSKDLHDYFPVHERKVIVCPGCLSAEVDSEFVKLGFIYKWCKNCFSLYASPRPTEASVDEFYRSSRAMEFYGSRIFKPTIDSRYEHQIRPLSSWVEEIVSKYSPKAKTVLDFMPKFYSVWAESPKSSKRKIWFVDPVHLVSYPPAAKKTNLKIAKKMKFDLITAFDVLDHRSEPQKTISDLSKMCKKGGIIFLTLNSGSGFEYQVLGRDSHRLVPPTRFNLLTSEVVQEILEKNNFEIIDLSTPGKLDIDIVSTTLFNDQSLPLLRFVSYFLQKKDKKVHQSFQQFLQENNMSSFLRVAARKK